MNEKLYRGLRKEYNTALHNSEWVHGYLLSEYSIGEVGSDLSSYWYANVIKKSIGRRTDMLSKADTHIYEGDRILYRQPIRTTQTHYGENIPNGEYTEPMEAGIKENTGIVIFDDLMFMIEDDDTGNAMPLFLINESWSLDRIEETIDYGKPDNFIWDDEEEGDLQYLMRIAKVNTPEELVEFLSGVEIIGNIHQKEIIL